MSYTLVKKRAEPYTKIVGELTQMRQGMVQLVRQAVSEGRCAYVSLVIEVNEPRR